MKSSVVDRDNNYCHCVIQRIAGFAITLYYHPAECDVIMTVYRLLCGLLVFFLVWVGSLSWWGRESSRRRVHSMISGGVVVISTAHAHFLDDRW
jgi:Na+/proline symporter